MDADTNRSGFSPRKLAWQVVLFVALAAITGAWLQSIDVDDALARVQAVRAVHLLVSALTLHTAFIARVVIWKLTIPTLRTRGALLAMYGGMGVTALVPLRLGEIFTWFALRRATRAASATGGKPISLGAALAALIFERLHMLAALLALASAGIVLVAERWDALGFNAGRLVWLVLALAATTLSWVYRQPLAALAGRLVRHRYAREQLDDFIAALARDVANARLMLAAITLSFVYWGLLTVSTGALFDATGVDVFDWRFVPIAALAGLGNVFFALPAGMSGAAILVYLLTALGTDPAAAGAGAALCVVWQTGLIVAPGVPAIVRFGGGLTGGRPPA